MRFESILFDMDGTVMNSEPSWLVAETELMSEYGYSWTLEDQAKCLGGPLTRMGEYMSSLVNGAKDGKFLREALIHRVEAEFAGGIDFMPGAEELLDDIYAAKIPMALVSASPRSLVQAAIDSLTRPYFHISVSSNDVLHTKPHPESYLFAASQLGVSIENSLVLEDSITGVTSAIASGACVIAIPHLVEIADHPRVRKVATLSGHTLATLSQLF